jgi:hypothetical protein
MTGGNLLDCELFVGEPFEVSLTHGGGLEALTLVAADAAENVEVVLFRPGDGDLHGGGGDGSSGDGG